MILLGTSVADVWQDSKYDCLRQFLPLGLHKRILNSLCLLIHTKHKTIRWNLGLTPRLHSLEGDLIHWVGMAKNLWLTVGLVLQYFSCKHTAPTTGVTEEHPELLLPPNSLYSHQTHNNKRKSWTDPKSPFPWRRRTHPLRKKG